MGLKVRANISTEVLNIQSFTALPNMHLLQTIPGNNLVQILEFDLCEDAMDVDALVVQKLGGHMQLVRLPDTIISSGGVELLDDKGRNQTPARVLNRFANIRVCQKLGTQVRVMTNAGEGWVDETTLGFDPEPQRPFRVLMPNGSVHESFSNEADAKTSAGRLALATRSRVKIEFLGRPGIFIVVDELGQST